MASASTIFTDTFTFGPGSGYTYDITAHEPINGSFTIPVTLQQFNSQLLGPGGALQNIAFVLSVTDSATATAQNDNLNGGPLYVTQVGGSVPVTASGPSGVNTSTTPIASTTFSPAHELDAVYSGCTFSGGLTCSNYNPGNVLTVSNTATSSSSTNVALGGFAPFVAPGPGSFISSLNLTIGPANVVGVGDSTIQYSASSTINGSLQVIYTYNTPEPVAFMLTGSGLLLCGLVIRRKRKA